VGTVDQGFVPAPPDRVYARLADLERYPEWWAEARIRRSADVLVLALPRLGRCEVRQTEERAGRGLVVRLAGRRLAGTLEWYLEPFKEGTVVNAILDLEIARGRVLRWRRAIRRGLVGLRRLAEAGADA
jgi:polyketide cyclase/dehydrase/lipid transport protein